MKTFLVAAVLAAQALPAFAADLSQWPAWRSRNRDAMTALLASVEASDASAEEKAEARQMAADLLRLFDATPKRIEASAAAARETLLARARDGQMGAGESVRDIMRVARLREAHLAYWEGTLVREIIAKFAEALEKPKPDLPHMVPGAEYVAAVRAHPVDTKALGGDLDLSQATDVLAEDAASRAHQH